MKLVALKNNLVSQILYKNPSRPKKCDKNRIFKDYFEIAQEVVLARDPREETEKAFNLMSEDVSNFVYIIFNSCTKALLGENWTKRTSKSIQTARRNSFRRGNSCNGKHHKY